jgi:hypothetical protein
MSFDTTPLMAIVVRDGQVGEVVTENWPVAAGKPQLLVVDYDTTGLKNADLVRFTVGKTVHETGCYWIEPLPCETAIGGLVPSRVADAMQLANEAAALTPRLHAQALKNEVLSYMRGLVTAGLSPEGRHIDDLDRLLSHELRVLRASLGDAPDDDEHP